MVFKGENSTLQRYVGRNTLFIEFNAFKKGKKGPASKKHKGVECFIGLKD